ncbi:MAG TPA: hypothetical protein VN843_29250 [Anaerolineales bacterium]|nr:hypothetical protein [Anaerolineales bacterium]
MRLVGRRVKIIKAEDSYGALGKIGVVVANNAFGGPLVRIKGWDQGHSGNLEYAISGECWFFSRKALRLLPKKKVQRLTKKEYKHAV